MMRMFAVQLSLLLAGTLLFAWALLTHFADLRPRYWMIIAAAVLVAPLHELTHALAFPGSTRSTDRALIFWPRRFVLCAQYQAVLSRNRYLFVLLTPFLTLSLLPTLACALFQIASAPRLCIVLLLFNALVCGEDVLAALLVVAQVPADGSIRNECGVTLWKPAPARAGTRECAT